MLLFLYAPATAQRKTDTIFTGDIRLFEKITDKTLLYVDKGNDLPPGQLPGVFTDTIPSSLSKKIPPSLVSNHVYLQFVVHNNHDSADSLYLLPGFFFREIEVYKWDPFLRRATSVRGGGRSAPYPGCYQIVLEAHETATLVTKLLFVKTTVNTLDPMLVKSYYVKPLLEELHDSVKDRNAATYVITGVLLMMIFYSIAVYVQNGNMEFLYYAGYAFFMGILFFLKSYLHKTPSYLNNYFESYFDFLLQCIATFIYLAFLGAFIRSKKYFPFLHILLDIQKLIILFGIVVFTCLNVATEQFVLQNAIEYSTKYMWLLGTIIFIFYAFEARNYLLNYLAVGQFFLLFCGLVSLYLTYSVDKFSKLLPPMLNDSLFYYELGVAIELAFFLMALAVKNKTDIVEQTKDREYLKLKNERQELEKQLAVFSAQQQERTRISADMHDELGSGVTAIRLMSEIVKAKMKENTLPEINRISNAANELINKMNTIIWVMKSENDSLQSLISYIRIYALEFFEGTSIDCDVNIPSSFANFEISGEKRRNIFLSVKESLNNVLKHSRATKVILSFIIGDKLVITITDNGVGIELEKVRQFGNGLANIKKRIEGIDGSYRIENDNGKGTRTSLVISL